MISAGSRKGVLECKTLSLAAGLTVGILRHIDTSELQVMSLYT